jgi:hypothetical protein
MSDFPRRKTHQLSDARLRYIQSDWIGSVYSVDVDLAVDYLAASSLCFTSTSNGNFTNQLAVRIQ